MIKDAPGAIGMTDIALSAWKLGTHAFGGDKDAQKYGRRGLTDME